MNEQLETSLSRATFLAKAFIAWNVVFFAISLAAAGTIAHDAVVTVRIRQGVFAAAGFLLVYLIGRTRQGRRGSWLRWASSRPWHPSAVIAVVAFTPDLQLWFDVAQVGSGLILVGIASTILRKDVRRQFPKLADEPVAQDSPA